MAGLYIHIPFCKSRCIYCGFFSSTLLHLRDRYVDALCAEMHLHHGLSSSPAEPVSTIYLGGGTPSVLSHDNLQQLFESIYKIYKVEPDAEVTIECNPDDITRRDSPLFFEGTNRIALPVNRVSMGAQTFSDDRLRFLNRRHTAQQVGKAVDRLRDAGINNISIDLMFGFPGQTLAQWNDDIRQAISLNPEHISAYALTYEANTPLYTMRRQAISDELSLAMYMQLIDSLTDADYEHYEISNFARITTHSRQSTLRSRHNSSYWQGIPYTGLGAAAHSYDIDTRHWNVDDINQYILMVGNHQLPIQETEKLTTRDKYNDMVTTFLRTCEGINLNLLSQQFGETYYDHLMANAMPHINNHRLAIDGQRLHLTRGGLFLSDAVMTDLIYV